MSEKKYLTIVEASRQFDVSRTHIYNRISAGKLENKEEGGTIFVSEEDMKEYVSNLVRRTRKPKKEKKIKEKKQKKDVSVVEQITDVSNDELGMTTFIVFAVALTGGVIGYFVASLLFN